MVIGLHTLGEVFETQFWSASGRPFRGVMMPIQDSEVPSYDFSEPRTLMRVRADCPMGVGHVIMDDLDRRWLLATQDATRDWITFKLFPLNAEVRWEREERRRDLLTNRPMAEGRICLEHLWVLREQGGRERTDGVIRVAEQTHRIITGAPLQLGDFIDNVQVKRVDSVLGVWLAEVQ